MAPQGTVCTLTLTEYIQACALRRQVPKAILDLAAQSQSSKEIVCILSALGWMEPAAAWRPGACDPAVEVEYEVTVPPATYDATGKLIPSEKLVIAICAPINRSLVVDILRVQPGNLTAAKSGQTRYKKVNLGGFGEFCLPFEPENVPGRFSNVEHLVVCPGAGFSVFAENDDPCSEAVFNFVARMWGSC